MGYLSDLYQRVVDFVTPESNGEAVVDAIYGAGGTAQRGAPDPTYDIHDLSSPNIYVAAKGAITSAASSLGDSIFGNLKTLALVAGAFLLVAVFVYGYARKL